MVIKAVIFDLGGVIIPYPPYTFRKGIAKLLKLDFDIVNKEIDKIDTDFALGKINERKFWGKLSSTFNIVVSEKNKKNFITDQYSKKARLNNDVMKIAIKLKNAGYKIGIISNILKPHADYLKTKRWLEDFSPIIFSCEVGLVKPDERIYNLILEKLTLEAKECVFIDDRKVNVEGAERVGIKTILFQNVKQLRKKLISYGIRLKNNYF